MDLLKQLQIMWKDVAIGMLLLVVVSVGGWTYYLRSRANQLKQTDIPRERENLNRTRQLISRLQNMESQPSRDVKNKREKLQSLETVLINYLREAGYPDASQSVNPTLLPSRKVEGTRFRRGGIRFTIEGLPLPYLARTLHMLETRFPTLVSQEIQLTRLTTSRSGPDVIENGSVTLVYFLTAQSE